jgi:hypothetical protein
VSKYHVTVTKKGGRTFEGTMTDDGLQSLYAVKLENGQVEYATVLDQIERKPVCEHCDKPVRDCGLCAWHLDVEAACNIAEDRCGGMTPESVVDGIMEEWGWDMTIQHP